MDKRRERKIFLKRPIIVLVVSTRYSLEIRTLQRPACGQQQVRSPARGARGDHFRRMSQRRLQLLFPSSAAAVTAAYWTCNNTKQYIVTRLKLYLLFLLEYLGSGNKRKCRLKNLCFNIIIVPTYTSNILQFRYINSQALLCYFYLHIQNVSVLETVHSIFNHIKKNKVFD